MKNKLLLIILVLIVSYLSFLALEYITSARKEIKFSQCDRVNTFRSMDWYTKMDDLLGEDNMLMKQVDEACYSKDANTVIFIISGKKCEGSRLFKYDLASNNIEQAETVTQGVKCMHSPKEFGVQKGRNMLLGGVVADGDCSSVMSFEYDYLDNIYSLKTEYINCSDDLEGEWRNY